MSYKTYSPYKTKAEEYWSDGVFTVEGVRRPRGPLGDWYYSYQIIFDGESLYVSENALHISVKRLSEIIEGLYHAIDEAEGIKQEKIEEFNDRKQLEAMLYTPPKEERKTCNDCKYRIVYIEDHMNRQYCDLHDRLLGISFGQPACSDWKKG